MTGDVTLREVIPADLPIFYEQQLDPVAVRMAAVPSREKPAFDAHWEKILANNRNQIRTILYEGQVAGNVLCFQLNGETDVGYWLGRSYWGKGIATQALKGFLELIDERPLFAHVAQHNLGSRRVLEKCSFVVIGENSLSFGPGDENIPGWIFRLD